MMPGDFIAVSGMYCFHMYSVTHAYNMFLQSTLHDTINFSLLVIDYVHTKAWSREKLLWLQIS